MNAPKAHPRTPAAAPPEAQSGRVSAAGGALVRTLFNLWPYIWPADRRDLKARVVLAMAILVVAKLATVAVPFTFKWATDALAGQGVAPAAGATWRDSWLTWVLAAPVVMTLAYGGMRVLMAGLTQLRDGIFAKVAMHAVRRLAILTFDHMHRLSLRFHLERKTGGLTRVLERGRNGIEIIVRMVILQLAPTIVELALIAAVLLWQFDWRYVAVVLVTVALYMAFTYYATEWRIGIRRRMNDSDNDANTKAIDSLLNYETVKYFVAEEREGRRYDRSMARYEDASVKAITSLAVLNAGQAFIFTVGLAATMVMCAYGIREGRNTVGDFVMINAMMIQLYQPLNFMGMVYREIKQAATDIETMFSLLARDPEIRDRPGAPALAVAAGEVRFDNVSFAYEPDRPILGGVSFTVPAGHTVAIVGPSGAGKSTISRLLFRFYDVTDGRILIDGQDIRDVTQVSLRAAIGMVPQDTVLFNDTIRYNIRYGRWEASDAEVEEAARLAQIDGFIRLSPKGYETEVGERGLKLSGGEKQRVAIARTILKSPPILLLDEATSALDSHTEKEIQDALDRVSRNRTTLVIAHRLSTIVAADEIIVLEAGRIAERGTHAGLLARGGLYASMWNRQREAEQARETLARAGEEVAAPNRNPPPVEDEISAAARAPRPMAPVDIAK
ncbi:MAG: ABC transporter ATP-binding protein/permease [Pseudorhodoplanes sp.]|nr:MAG: ABC transporter ATP-binding protein/permease [Pseudorhodoplanes sp.]